MRFLDETLAVVLLRIIGTLRRPRTRPDSPRRIGIMKSTGIGDMVLATAVVRDLIERFPDAEVVIFAGADNAGVAKLVEGAETVQLPTAKPWAALPLIRAEKLDVMIDLGQWTRLEALYTALSGARWTAGFATEGQRRHHAYDATAPHSAVIPEIDNYRAVTATLGVPGESLPRFAAVGERPPIPVTEPYAVFHMWPGGFRSELREWSPDRWRELVEVAAAHSVAVLLSGGPGDVERTERFLADCPEPTRPASAAGEFGLDDLIGVLERAVCVVSVNTGVMHLAAATGTCTIALNGPTNSKRWGPIGPRTTNIDSTLPGCGYLNLGFEYDGQRTDCMEGITVEAVAEAMLSCIDG